MPGLLFYSRPRAGLDEVHRRDGLGRLIEEGSRKNLNDVQGQQFNGLLIVSNQHRPKGELWPEYPLPGPEEDAYLVTPLF
jgi:hypothetical protein